MTTNLFFSQDLKNKFIEKYKINENNKKLINIQNIKTFLINFLLINKNEEKNMIINIVNDYFEDFKNKVKNEEKKYEKLELWNDDLFIKFFDNWKLNMYNSLLNYYEIDQDDDFREEMINNPDKYGLNYEAYQIITK